MTDDKLVLIGDIMASRQVKDRAGLQSKLIQVIELINKRNPGLDSPYTLTLGDEFQAVLNRADQVFHDLVSLSAAIYPCRARFALALGRIETPINPHQAIGMDGEAFHLARAVIDELKKDDELFGVKGLQGPGAALAVATLRLLSWEIRKWKHTRIQVLDLLLADHSVAQMARRLNLSDKTIYKSIDAGNLHRVIQTFEEIATLINLQMQDT